MPLLRQSIIQSPPIASWQRLTSSGALPTSAGLLKRPARRSLPRKSETEMASASRKSHFWGFCLPCSPLLMKASTHCLICREGYQEVRRRAVKLPPSDKPSPICKRLLFIARFRHVGLSRFPPSNMPLQLPTLLSLVSTGAARGDGGVPSGQIPASIRGSTTLTGHHSAKGLPCRPQRCASLSPSP